MSENEIPPRFAGAATSLAEVRQWSDAVLSGAAARLVVLGPIWSGKTHTAYAAVGQLLRAGYPLEQIVVHQAHGLAIGGKYEPALIDSGPPVIVLDDVTGEVDNRAGVSAERPVDDPESQAALAATSAAVADAVERLVSRARTSWIVCASGVDQLNQCVGADVTAKLLAVAQVINLPPRPLPPPVTFD